MTTLAIHREPAAIALPLPGPRAGAIAIRVGTEDDLPFIDELQKKHSKAVGFLMLPVLTGHMKHGRVLVAEQGSGGGGGERVGYCIANDRYQKHDDCGIVYQLNVIPTKHRGLIGATMLKAIFDRAAYGCKLFCCWCAQDLEANRFWESMGFVPLAFRTGSRPRMRKDGSVSKPERIHIFWQRRIREGDTETPYWFPAETTGGAINEGRIVLPIPPGTHWSDAKPAILPGMEQALKSLPHPGAEVEKKPREKKKPAAPARPPSRGVWVAPPPPTKEQLAAAKKAAKEKPKPRAKFKNDPKLIAAARELRDRYIDEINAGLLLPPSACGKYDVSRALEAAPSSMKQTPLLNAA